MYMTLQSIVEITIIVTYMPQSERPIEEKQEASDNLQK